jgi:hypothetical protein
VQPNRAGTQYQRSRLDLQTAGNGVLRILSSMGSNTGAGNSQQNALQLFFDATRGNWRATGRLLSPLADMHTPFQQKAIYVGPNQDNYLKIEVEIRSGGGAYITLFFEQNGGGRAVAGPLRITGAVNTLDLFLDATVASHSFRASYRVNSNAVGDIHPLGNAVSPSSPGAWFTTRAKAGVLTSNTGTNTPVTAVYDSFAVVAR